MKVLGSLVVCVALLGLGCSSKGGGSTPPPTNDSPTDSGAPAADEDAALAPPAVGFQLLSTPVTMAPGEEQYLCWSFVLPKDAPLNVIATQPQISPHGVHHYAIFTKTGAVPANPVAYDCKVMDATWGLVAGGGVGTPGLTFPTGTAMTLAAGSQVVFQLHLLNATSEPQNPSGIVNLIGSTDDTLTQVGLLIAGTLDITIPPHQSNVKVQGGCNAPFDMPNVFALFPHMHQLGTNIEMTLTPQGSTTPNILIDKAWDFGNQGVYPATGSAKKGDGVNVQCTYDNSSDNTVTFGESTTNEMCIGVFFYWPLAPGGMGGLGGSNYCGI
jgi:hypothetical protein